MFISSCCSGPSCVCCDGEKILVSISRDSLKSCVILFKKSKIENKVIDSIIWIPDSNKNYEIKNSTFTNTLNIKDFNYLIYDKCNNKKDSILNIEYVINGGICEEKCFAKQTFKCLQHRLSNFKIYLNNKEIKQPKGFETETGLALIIE